MKGLTMFSLSQ